MRMEDIQAMRIGGRDVVEVRLGGNVVWPTNVVTYSFVPFVKYYTNSGTYLGTNNAYIPASGQGYATLFTKVTKYNNGVIVGEYEIAASGVTFDGGNQYGAPGQTWTISSNKITVTTRGANVDTSATTKNFRWTCTYEGQTYNAWGIPVSQQQNVKIYGATTTTLQEINLSTNRYGSSSAACVASGSSNYEYATITCTGNYKDSKPVSYTSGATGTAEEEYRNNVTISPSTVTYTLSNSYAFRYGGNSVAQFKFYSLGATSAPSGVTTIITGSYGGKQKTITLYQAKNIKIPVGNPTYSISLSANRYTTSSSPCPASGGNASLTVTCEKTQNGNWSSGTPYEDKTYPTSNISFTSNEGGLSVSNNTAYWENRTNQTGNLRSGSITASYSEGGQVKCTSNAVVIYQQANTATTSTSRAITNFTATANGNPTGGMGGSSSSNYWIVSAKVTTTTTTTYTSNYDPYGNNNAQTSEANLSDAAFSVSGSGLNKSGNKVYWSNAGTTESRNGSISASYTGATSPTPITVTQTNSKSTTYNLVFNIDGNTGNFTIDDTEQFFDYTCYERAVTTYDSGASNTADTNVTPTTSSNGFSVSGGNIYVSRNTNSYNRTGTIYAQGAHTARKSIAITQTYQQVYLRFGSTTYTASYNTSTIYVSVESNINWTLTTPSGSFATGSTSGQGNRNQIPIMLLTNYGSTRSVTITLQGTGSNSGLTASATITQTAYTGQWIGELGASSHQASFGADDDGFVIMVPIKLNGNALVQTTGNTGWYQMLTPLPINASTSAVSFRCIEPNETGANRSAVIRFKVSGQDDLLLTLTQRYY